MTQEEEKLGHGKGVSDEFADTMTFYESEAAGYVSLETPAERYMLNYELLCELGEHIEYWKKKVKDRP